MKKIIMATCLLFLITGCKNHKQANPEKSEKPKQATAETKKKEAKTVAKKTTKSQVDADTYQNKKYGFQVTLTDNWKTYKTKIEETETDKIVRFCASIPDSKIHTEIPGYQCLFRIIISDKVKWDEEVKPCKKDRDSGMCDWIDKELGRNNDYVFSWEAVQDHSAEEKKYFQDISAIIDSFKIINN